LIANTPRSASKLTLCGAIFDAPSRKSQLSKTEELIHAPDFWANPEKSQKIMQDRKRLEEQVAHDARIGGMTSDLDTLFELAREGENVNGDLERELKVLAAHLEQLETLSDPTRSPKEWQLATAYLGLIPSDSDPELPGDTDWHRVDELPPLAFDHGSIVLSGRERLRAKLSYTNLGFALAPDEFTISELRDLYAAALGHDVSATNLQRVLLRREVLEPTGRQRASVPTGGRPGSLFRFRTPELEITDQFAVLRPPGPARLPIA